MTEIAPGNPVLLVFREILDGDIKKVRAESNITPSGGGARDLRFPKSDTFGPIVARLFPNPTGQEGVVHSLIYWDENGGLQSADIKFWRPTDARPNEARIGKINLVRKWLIDEAAYRAAQQNGSKWFFLLLLDDNNRVWAQVLREEILDNQTPIVRDYIRHRIRETPPNKTVFGALDFITGDTYP